LTAIDPVSGEVRWSFDVPYPHDAGALVTAGGLVFSAFADRQFRALDASTGDVLWTQVLTAHSDSAPITFEVDDRQYVAILAGRDTPVHSLPESGLPDSIAGPATLFVFTLPQSD
jgi:glucose dehydrogenase